MQNKKLTLRPLGGLANRMLAIASAVTLSKESSRSLTIIWEQDEKLNCPFYLLFNPIPEIEVINSATTIPLIRKIKRHLSHFSYKKIIHHDQLQTVINDKSILSEFHHYDNILIYGANQFYSIDRIADLFIPSNNINEQLKSMLEKFKHHTVGVHIRRTDHGPSIEKSPTRLFIKKMKEEINNNSDTLFFLATDDPKEELELTEKFGQRVLTFNKTFERDSVDGIQNALVDLLCLASCSKIYGSFYSSFSYTAAQMQGAELHVLTVDTNSQD